MNQGMSLILVFYRGESLISSRPFRRLWSPPTPKVAPTKQMGTAVECCVARCMETSLRPALYALWKIAGVLFNRVSACPEGVGSSQWRNAPFLGNVLCVTPISNTWANTHSGKFEKGRRKPWIFQNTLSRQATSRRGGTSTFGFDATKLQWGSTARVSGPNRPLGGVRQNSRMMPVAADVHTKYGTTVFGLFNRCI